MPRVRRERIRRGLDRVTEALRGARDESERIEGPGHWMQLEAPDAVNTLLLDFLPH